MSLSADLCLGNVERIVHRLGLTEQTADDGGAFRTLTSPMVPDGSVGSQRVWRRDGVCDLVYVGLTVPMIGLDSHMLFAFTPPGSAVPHFTLDSVAGGGEQDRAEFAFHLDLIPKMDLGAHLGYLDHCFGPLTDLLERGEQIDGLTPARLSPRQYAVMSAWMFVHRADEAAFRSIAEIVDAYRDHWFGLVEAGVPDALLDGTTTEALAERDRRNRSIVFDPDVDPVWGRVARLLGDEQAETVRAVLATPLP